MADRSDILTTIGASIRSWTIKADGSVSARPGKDTEALLQVLREHPDLPQRVAAAQFNPEAEKIRQMMLERIHSSMPAAGSSQPTGSGVTDAPANPTRWSNAVTEYAARKAKLALKTRTEQTKLLSNLQAFLAGRYPALGDDPMVHEVQAHHLTAFIDTIRHKSNTDGKKTEAAAAPLTVLKKISHLRTFFHWARTVRQFTLMDPADSLEELDKVQREEARMDQRHYQPFSAAQLQSIFDPAPYLAYNKSADYFWMPLLGLHLGARMKELVTLNLSDVDRDAATGLWFIDVIPEFAKNRNSVRRLPVPQRLHEIGFIDYVERLKSLGATKLFPHINFDTATAKKDPSKNGSRQFGNYLDSLKITHPDLVFHSFRHVVVTALQLGQTPLIDAMQITGHTAQEHAIRTGQITAADARSVHLQTYSHADKASLSGDSYPLQRLKDHLDRCISVPLDYERLRRAACIVAEHTVRNGEGFTSGWATQDKAYTELQIARLA